MADRDADLLSAFINWNVYNGAPGAGQAIYNYGGNPWLHERIESFLKDYAAEQYFSEMERMFGTDAKLMQAVKRARGDLAGRRLRENVGSTDE